MTLPLEGFHNKQVIFACLPMEKSADSQSSDSDMWDDLGSLLNTTVCGLQCYLKSPLCCTTVYYCPIPIIINVNIFLLIKTLAQMFIILINNITVKSSRKIFKINYIFIHIKHVHPRHHITTTLIMLDAYFHTQTPNCDQRENFHDICAFRLQRHFTAYEFALCIFWAIR